MLAITQTTFPSYIFPLFSISSFQISSPIWIFLPHSIPFRIKTSLSYDILTFFRESKKQPQKTPCRFLLLQTNLATTSGRETPRTMVSLGTTMSPAPTPSISSNVPHVMQSPCPTLEKFSSLKTLKSTRRRELALLSFSGQHPTV